MHGGAQRGALPGAGDDLQGAAEGVEAVLYVGEEVALLVVATSRPRSSSLTTTLSWSPSSWRRTTALEAWAYFWMFWRASRVQN